MRSIGLLDAEALGSAIADALQKEPGVRAVHLFGSAVETGSPADVDLVVVYGPPLVPRNASELRAHLEETVQAVCALRAHIMFFTEREAEQPGLIEPNAVAIYVRD